MSYELVIFDCDGVLIDSEPLANRVLAERLEAIDVSLPLEEVMRLFVGRTRAGCLDLAAELSGRALPRGFAEDWDVALFATFDRELRAIEGVEEALRGLALPYCVASNSSAERMRVSLRAAGLLPSFDGRMFSAAEVARPKPAPDLFLHAARTLGAAPARCAVIEDTPTGARAGVAAGMTVFGYAGGAHSDPAQLKAAGARVFGRMRDLGALLSAPGR